MSKASEHFTDEDVQAVAEELVADYGSEYSADHLGWKDFEWPARKILLAVAPSITARALREEASPLVIDARDQGLGLGAAQRSIWRRSIEIESGEVDAQ